jgi:dTMP kinase
MKKGCLLTFEGGEGAGKSTQIRLLQIFLEEQGIATLVTREPGGTPLAERLRAVLLSGKTKPLGGFAEALLFNGARLDHVETLIRPALQKGLVVLCDRFIDSTRAYQSVTGAVDAFVLRALERVVLNDLKPDLTFILDCPPALSATRIAARSTGSDRFETEPLAIHETIREAFLAIAKADPERCIIIDAAREINAVQAAIRTRLAAHLAGHLPQLVEKEGSA